MKVKWREGLAWQQLGEQIVIIDSRINKEVHRLNSLAAVLWQKMNEPIDENELCDFISKEYEVDKKELSNDIADFLDSLKSKQLIVEG